jgi:hypothetical protein
MSLTIDKITFDDTSLSLSTGQILTKIYRYLLLTISEGQVLVNEKSSSSSGQVSLGSIRRIPDVHESLSMLSAKSSQ